MTPLESLRRAYGTDTACDACRAVIRPEDVREEMRGGHAWLVVTCPGCKVEVQAFAPWAANPPTQAEMQEIEACAKAATPGPWSVGPRVHEDTVSAVYYAPHGLIVNVGDGHLGKASHDANAKHIARMDPPTTLRLLAALRHACDVAKAERVLREAALAGYSGPCDEHVDEPDACCIDCATDANVNAAGDKLRALGVEP